MDNTEAVRQIYIIHNRIAKINATKKHYLEWMECSNTNPSLTFVEYLDQMKAAYQDEIDIIRGSMDVHNS